MPGGNQAQPGDDAVFRWVLIGIAAILLILFGIGQISKFNQQARDDRVNVMNERMEQACDNIDESKTATGKVQTPIYAHLYDKDGGGQDFVAYNHLTGWLLDESTRTNRDKAKTIACIQGVSKTIKQCSYVDGKGIEFRQQQIIVSLVDLEQGFFYGRQTIQGSHPEDAKCPERKASGVSPVRYVNRIEKADINQWLAELTTSK